MDYNNIVRKQLILKERDCGMTVKELRLKTGMNRTEFSDYLKIPYQTVKNWENGISECKPMILRGMYYELLVKKKIIRNDINMTNITYAGRILTEQEVRAVREALCDINYYDVADDAERIQEWLEDDTIFICECRNKRKAACVLVECDDAAVYIDNLESLSKEEIKEQLE